MPKDMDQLFHLYPNLLEDLATFTCEKWEKIKIVHQNHDRELNLWQFFEYLQILINY